MTDPLPKRRPFARLLTVAVLLGVMLSGLAVLGGTPAAGLTANVSEPYPQTPGSTSNMTAVATVQSNDTVVQGGVRRVRINVQSPNFDGSLSDVTANNVEVFVDRANGDSSDTIQAANIGRQNDTHLTARLSRSLSVSPGDEVIVRVRGFRNPSEPGSHPLRLTLGTGSGGSDGPISVPYRLVPADLNFSDQRVNANGSQTVRLTGVTPDQGYVVIYQLSNGNPRNIVGVGKTEPNYHQQSYTADINISQGQELEAILYYETSGDTIAERRQASFNASDDARVLNNGQSVTARSFVDLAVPTEHIRAGDKYRAGHQLLFTAGEPSSEYSIGLVDDTQAEEIATFETNSSGAATIDTTNFSTGSYAIVTETGRDVVSLDNDSITNPTDDSFRIVNPQQEANQSANQSTASAEAEAESGGGGGIGTGTIVFGGLFGMMGVGVVVFYIQYRRLDTT